MKKSRTAPGSDAGENDQQQGAAEEAAAASAGSEGEGEGAADDTATDSEAEEEPGDDLAEKQATADETAAPIGDTEGCPDGMARLYVLRDPIFNEVRHVGGCSAPLDDALLEGLQHELAPSQPNARWIERLARRGMKPRIQALTDPLPIEDGKARLPAIVARYKALTTAPVTSDLDPPEAESAE